MARTKGALNQKLRTHCRKGHLYDRTRGNGRWNLCGECARESSRKYAERNPELSTLAGRQARWDRIRRQEG